MRLSVNSVAHAKNEVLNKRPKPKDTGVVVAQFFYSLQGIGMLDGRQPYDSIRITLATNALSIKIDSRRVTDTPVKKKSTLYFDDIDNSIYPAELKQKILDFFSDNIAPEYKVYVVKTAEVFYELDITKINKCKDTVTKYSILDITNIIASALSDTH